LHDHRGYNAGEVARFDDETADLFVRGRHADHVQAAPAPRTVEATMPKMVKPAPDKRPTKGPGVVTK
jgi:hypothetical protein